MTKSIILFFCYLRCYQYISIFEQSLSSFLPRSRSRSFLSGSPPTALPSSSALHLSGSPAPRLRREGIPHLLPSIALSETLVLSSGSVLGSIRDLPGILITHLPFWYVAGLLLCCSLHQLAICWTLSLLISYWKLLFSSSLYYSISSHLHHHRSKYRRDLQSYFWIGLSPLMASVIILLGFIQSNHLSEKEVVSYVEQMLILVAVSHFFDGLQYVLSEDEHIKTNQQNILIRSLKLKKQKEKGDSSSKNH